MSDFLSQAEIDALLSQSADKEVPTVDDRILTSADGQQAAKMGGSVAAQHPNLDRILDIPVRISVRLGQTEKHIRDVVGLTPGAIVDFDRNVNNPVDIMLNGKLIARGEVVVVGEHFGVRITQIITPQQRVEKMQS